MSTTALMIWFISMAIFTFALLAVGITAAAGALPGVKDPTDVPDPRRTSTTDDEDELTVQEAAEQIVPRRAA